MLIEDQYLHNKAIMIAVLGRPNAGKSTLINHLLGFDLSIVSSKPQTTRNHFHCAFTIDHTEVVLVDTPGVHTSSQELNKRMNGEAQRGAEGVDLNFILLDATGHVLQDFKNFTKSFENELIKFEPLLVPSFSFTVPPTEAELPIITWSIAKFESVISAELAVSVPATWSNMSVKYCPPITDILFASPLPSTPPSPINILSPKLLCVPVP